MYYPLKILTVFLFVKLATSNIATSNNAKVLRKENLTNEEKLFLRRAARGKLMRSYMNVTADPCEDFYEYSCGNWNKLNRPPSVFDENDVFQYISRRMERNMVGLIRDESSDSETADNEALKKVKSYYQSCICHDFSTYDKSSEKVELLDRIFGPYVLTPAWSSSGFDWLGVVARMQVYGANAFVYESVSKDSGRPLTYIKKGIVTLPGVDIADLLFGAHTNGLKLNSSNVVRRYGQLDEHLLNGVVQFAVNLTNLEWSRTDQRSQQIQELTLEELKLKAPAIDWTRYFTILLGSSMNFSMSLIVEDIDYFNRVAALVEKSEPDIVAAYLALHFLDYLQENVLISKYSTARYCSMRVLEDLPLATYVLHVKQFNLTATKPEVLQMAKDLQSYYTDTIQVSSWISNPTKSQLISKLNSTKLEIGYPDSISSNNQLDKIYKDLTINSDNFDRSFLQCLEFKSRSMHNKLSPLIDGDIDLNLSLIDIKPRYDLKTNRITIPAGILVPPIYHHQLPVAFKFGALGSLIASAFTDILHSVYRQFSEKDDAENLQKLRKCLQGGNTSVANSEVIGPGQDELDGMFLGILPNDPDMDDLIADLIGLHVATAVLQNWITSSELGNDNMPGLNMTSDQLFYLSFAQTHCGDGPLEQYFTGGNPSDFENGGYGKLQFLYIHNRFLDTFHCTNLTKKYCF